MIRAACVAWCAALLLFVAAPAGAQSRQSTNALASWINAVKAHAPGKQDPPLGFVAELKYSDRAILSPAMQLFLAALRGDSIPTRSAEQRQILDLYRTVRTNPGLAPFLERAAVLHADAAILRDRLQDFVDDAPPPSVGSMSVDPRGGLSGSRSSPQSALLTNEAALTHTDGRLIGQTSLNWNWTFARSLLDLLLPKQPEHRGDSGVCRGAECMGTLAQGSGIATKADEAFVAAWYHATAAYLLANGKHADLKRHLTRATEVLPEDAHILFDRACYAETLGLPVYQALPNDPNYWNARTRVSVPSAERTDEEAEKLFRHAIDVDPAYAEARVRLARLFEGRGLHDEAAAQIDQALAVEPAKAVTFFAHIVAGRIAESRGREHDSLGQYRAALAIYPEAQSALLGASHAAVMASDVPAALSFVATLARRSGDDSDPWWIYDLGAGRDTADLLAALWARIPQ